MVVSGVDSAVASVAGSVEGHLAAVDSAVVEEGSVVDRLAAAAASGAATAAVDHLEEALVVLADLQGAASEAEAAAATGE